MESTIVERLKRISNNQTLKLTHYGRNTGQACEVRIRFVAAGDNIYPPTGNVNRQWVRNVKKTPRVRLSVGGEMFDGEARFLSEPGEHDRVMPMVRRKYWMFLPMIAIWRLLAALNLAQFATGVFEVTLSQP